MSTTMSKVYTISGVVLILLVQAAIGFQLQHDYLQRKLARNRNQIVLDQASSTSSSTSSTDAGATTSIERYTYKDWNLTYRYKKGSQTSNIKKQRGWSSLLPPPKKSQAAPSLFLIHPVGIGLDSWFWEKLMDEQRSSNQFDIYAPDLIGCGTLNGGDAWDPDVKPLSFPLGWAEGIEPLLPRGSATDTTLVCQGGLAPVAVLLASRYPDLISRVVLTSPPTYDDMVTAVPQNELKRNFDFLTNPLSAKVAFGLLESEWALRFFSNAFLFTEPCDDLWIQRALETISPEQRFPVAAFNAGLCNHRSFVNELASQITQPTLILSGLDDKRNRQGYVDNMPNCKWQRLEGCNVLPWENPAGVYQAIHDFCDFIAT
jgi:pimeloyl-ACP methyl ester carboxylesterase